MDLSDIQNPQQITIQSFDDSKGFSESLQIKLTGNLLSITTCFITEDKKQILYRKEIPLSLTNN